MTKRIKIKEKPIKPQRREVFESFDSIIHGCSLQDLIDHAKRYGLEPKDVLLVDEGGPDYTDIGYYRPQTDEEYMDKYIGIDEINDWEGKTFGYYFQYSEEIEEKLNEFKNAVSTTSTDDIYAVDLEGYTEEEIKAINKSSSNSYMDRITIIDSDTVDWEKILNWCKVVEEGPGIYKGMPLKDTK